MKVDWISLARQGGQVQRCHTVPTIRPYNNAEHTAGALVIAKELCEANEMGVSACADVMEYLLVHDMAEAYCGDTPANVKLENKALAQQLDVVERDWEVNNVPGHYVAKHHLSAAQRRICRAADLIELGYYCVEEREMGNARIWPVWDNVVKYMIGFEGCIPGAAELMSHLRERWRVACG